MLFYLVKLEAYASLAQSNQSEEVPWALLFSHLNIVQNWVLHTRSSFPGPSKVHLQWFYPSQVSVHFFVPAQDQRDSNLCSKNPVLTTDLKVQLMRTEVHLTPRQCFLDWRQKDSLMTSCWTSDVCSPSSQHENANATTSAGISTGWSCQHNHLNQCFCAKQWQEEGKKNWSTDILYQVTVAFNC